MMTDSGSDNLRDELKAAQRSFARYSGADRDDRILNSLESVVVRRVADAKADPAIKRLVELAKDYVECVDGEWGCCHSYIEVTERSGCASKEIATEVESLVRALAVGRVESKHEYWCCVESDDTGCCCGKDKS